MRCILCGGHMVSVKCKYICVNCGYMIDCSDIVFIS